MNAPAHGGEGPRHSQPERFADCWPYARTRGSHLRIADPPRDAQFSQRVCGEQAFGKRHVSCRIYGTPEWRNGRRGGLKIRWSQGRVGSTPSSGTTNSSRFQCYFLDETASRWEFCAAELTLAKFSIRLITAEKS
jgi:hypothetical protein